MSVLFGLAGLIMLLVGFVCTIIVLVDAFKDSIWKGILFLLCGLYGLWYMLVEFDHENKWGIVLGSLGAGVVGGVFLRMGGWLD